MVDKKKAQIIGGRKYSAGVDEVGRGPLAGPVAVGIVVVPQSFDFSVFEYLDDSKKMTRLQRSAVYKQARALKKEGALYYKVTKVGPAVIDHIGINAAITKGIHRLCKMVDIQTQFLLDGLLKAPERFVRQETIIGGDALEPVISLASVVAKVERDKYMKNIAVRYPEYGFASHKGYGTKAHREAILKCGLCDIHRRSFTMKLTNK